MSGDDFGRVIYLVLLLLAVSGWMIAEGRRGLGKNLRMALIWGMIFLGVVAGYGLWGDVRDDIMPRQAVIGSGVIEAPLGTDGHYHLVLELNGVPVGFLVDTGASEVVLTRKDAVRIGLDLDKLSFHETAMTANGAVRSAPATVRTVTLGDIRDTNLRIAVNGGEMDGSLLGMSYLDRFDRIEISDGKLVLTRQATLPGQ